jgi:hypothetical protein
VEIDRTAKRLHDFVYTKDTVLLTDIRDFVQDSRGFLGSILEFADSCNDRYLLADGKRLTAIEHIGVDESIARMLEEVILPEVSCTMPIRSLTCWNRFPKILVPWTEWLVYSVLNKWSHNLETAPSYNQMRLSIPLVAPAGKMDVTPFAEAYKDIEFQYDDVALPVADDLDQIDDLLTDLMGEQLLEDALWD